MGSDPALYPVVRFMSAPRLCLALFALVLALVQPAAAARMIQPSVDPARFSAIHPHPLVPSSWDSSPMAVVGDSQMWDPTGEGCVDGGSWEDPFPGGKGDMRPPAFCVARPCLRMLSPDELARDVFGRPLQPGDWPVYLSRYRNSCLDSDPDAPVMVASAKDFDDLLGLPAATPAAVLLASGTGWVAPPVQGWTVVTAAAPANPRNVVQGPWPAPGAGLAAFLSSIGSSGGGGGSGPGVPVLTASSGQPAGSGPVPGGGGGSGGGSGSGSGGGSGDDGGGAGGGGSGGGTGGGSGGGNGGGNGSGGSGGGSNGGGSGGSGGNGGGAGVLAGTARVIEPDGHDVTDLFLAGAELTLALARAQGIRMAVLKESSPSCGSLTIHDGRFAGRRVNGEGVAAARLRQDGIAVFSEEQFAEADALLEQLDAPIKSI